MRIVFCDRLFGACHSALDAESRRFDPALVSWIPVYAGITSVMRLPKMLYYAF
jgi:hypothetical protein